MRASTSVSRSADALLHASALRLAESASRVLLAVLRGFLPLMLGAGLSWTANAVTTTAYSVSGAQVTTQGNTSSAYIVSGVQQPGYGAGPGGISSVGGSAYSVWADTRQTDINGTATVQANVRAAADLVSGSLRVYSEAGVSSGSGAFFSNAFGRASWLDTITFNNTSGAAVALDLFWQTDGAITPQRDDSRRYVTSSITLSRVSSFVGLRAANGDYLNYLGGAQYQYFGVDANAGDYFTFAPTGNNDAGAWRTSLGAGESGLISATLFVPTGLSSINIDAFLQVDCNNGAICDFGNTAKFGFGALPSGLSWTSESGVFLTAVVEPPPNGVPEPGSLALLAIALVGLAVVSRERARVRRSCAAA